MTSPRRQTKARTTREHSRETDVTSTPPSPPPQSPVYQRPQHVDRIGDILRRVREQRGDDLAHIAEYLCIRRGYLDAIESSDYEKLPADAYVIGFLRSYAELLGLDGREAINLYRAEMAGQRKKPALNMPTPMPEGRSPSVFILIGAAVAAIVIYVLWYGLSSSDRATVSTPPPLPAATTSSAPVTVPDVSGAPVVPTVPVVPVAPPAAQAAPEPSPTAAADTAPAKPEVTPPKADVAPPATADAATKPPHLMIRAVQSSWIFVTNKAGDTIFDRVLKPGEVYKPPDEPGLTLTTGNGAGIIISLDGVDLPKLATTQVAGPSGIMRDIPLDGARLKAITQAR